MELARLQSALAGLFTDAALRERFFADSAVVGRELGLQPDEIAQLAEVAREQIDDFARSLSRKRLGEVRDLLPLTARVLGSRFGPLFQESAARHRSGGIRKHLWDALAFVRSLQERFAREPAEPRWLPDLLCCEATWLEMRHSDRVLRIRLLRYSPARMLARVNTDEPAAEIVPRRCLAVWFRRRRDGRIWHRVFPPER